MFEYWHGKVLIDIDVANQLLFDAAQCHQTITTMHCHIYSPLIACSIEIFISKINGNH